MKNLRRGLVAVVLAVATVIGGTAGASGPAPLNPTVSGVVGSADRPVEKAAAQRPNIVVVMLDDFSMDLVQTMRSMRQMKRRGASYSHAFVTDTLCCVSRSSFFTGQYPSQTGVRTNTSHEGTSTLGGWPAFQVHGNPRRSFNVRLERAGYTTGFVGKYLNEYEWVPGRALPPVPPGWSSFNVVFGSAYDGWDFTSTYLDAGRMRIRNHPAPPASAPDEVKDEAYSDVVIGDLALDFIAKAETGAAPYFLEVATYGPHNRTQPEGHYPGDPLFPPMFRDRGARCGAVRCASLTTRDLPGFGASARDNTPRTRRGRRLRQWNTMRGLPASVAVRDLRDRARMAQAADRLIQRILRTVGPDTYVVLTSDNGFHLGQLGLGRGKGTAYDTDSHVPLYVVGPGVVPGVRREVTSNIDLAPTFEDLAGLRPAPYRSGVSLVPTFRDRTLVRRDHAFFEHTQQTLATGDPDAAYSGTELDRIPSFTAVRSRDFLLVRYDVAPSPTRTWHGYEFYSYRHHAWEKRNNIGNPRFKDEVRAMTRLLKKFDACTATGNERVSRECRNLTR